MLEYKSYKYMFDAQMRSGEIKTLSVFADNNAEAEETAIWLCHFVGALYLANLTRHRKCVL